MFYIVQMIVSGTVVRPRIFSDEDCAQKAFIGLVREHCATAFAQYCDVNEKDPESFVSAKSFADTRGREEICFCFWEQNPEAAEGMSKMEPTISQGRESVLKAVTKTQQQILGVQTELQGLTVKLCDMSQELIRLQNLFGDNREGAGSEEISAVPEWSKPTPDAPDKKYQTAEWQDFVQSLIQMCGGNWAEFPLLSRQDWRHAVYSNHTTPHYWEWVAITIDQSIERAKGSGYAVQEDDQKRGYFTYLTPTGELSSAPYEMEDLAWCAAGLHAAHEEATQGGVAFMEKGVRGTGQ